MTPKRLLAFCGAGLLLLIFGLAWRMGGEDYSDGESAVANVVRLRKGMTTYEALQTLHPVQMTRANTVSFTTRPNGSGSNEMYHSLTPDRYVVITTTQRPLPAHSGFSSTVPKSPGILSWTLRTGQPPREDVTIGRALQVGRLRFRY